MLLGACQHGVLQLLRGWDRMIIHKEHACPLGFRSCGADCFRPSMFKGGGATGLVGGYCSFILSVVRHLFQEENQINLLKNKFTWNCQMQI